MEEYLKQKAEELDYLISEREQLDKKTRKTPRDKEELETISNLIKELSEQLQQSDVKNTSEELMFYNEERDILDKKSRKTKRDKEEIKTVNELLKELSIRLKEMSSRKDLEEYEAEVENSQAKLTNFSNQLKSLETLEKALDPSVYQVAVEKINQLIEEEHQILSYNERIISTYNLLKENNYKQNIVNRLKDLEEENQRLVETKIPQELLNFNNIQEYEEKKGFEITEVDRLTKEVDTLKKLKEEKEARYDKNEALRIQTEINILEHHLNNTKTSLQSNTEIIDAYYKKLSNDQEKQSLSQKLSVDDTEKNISILIENCQRILPTNLQERAKRESELLEEKILEEDEEVKKTDYLDEEATEESLTQAFENFISNENGRIAVRSEQTPKEQLEQEKEKEQPVVSPNSLESVNKSIGESLMEDFQKYMSTEKEKVIESTAEKVEEEEKEQPVVSPNSLESVNESIGESLMEDFQKYMSTQREKVIESTAEKVEEEVKKPKFIFLNKNGARQKPQDILKMKQIKNENRDNEQSSTPIHMINLGTSENKNEKSNFSSKVSTNNTSAESESKESEPNLFSSKKENKNYNQKLNSESEGVIEIVPQSGKMNIPIEPSENEKSSLINGVVTKVRKMKKKAVIKMSVLAASLVLFSTLGLNAVKEFSSKRSNIKSQTEMSYDTDFESTEAEETMTENPIQILSQSGIPYDQIVQENENLNATEMEIQTEYIPYDQAFDNAYTTEKEEASNTNITSNEMVVENPEEREEISHSVTDKTIKQSSSNLDVEPIEIISEEELYSDIEKPTSILESSNITNQNILETAFLNSNLPENMAWDEYSAAANAWEGIEEKNIPYWTDKPLRFERDNQTGAYLVKQQDDFGNWVGMGYTDEDTVLQYYDNLNELNAGSTKGARK